MEDNKITFEQLDASRIKLRNRNILAILIDAVILLIGFFILIGLGSFGIIISIIVAIVVYTLLTHKVRAEYTANYKSYFVLRSLVTRFEDLKYQPEYGIPESVIGSTGMMYTGDRYHSNDYISGKYKGIPFEQSDVHIEEERETTDSDGHTQRYYVTIFLGRWMIFDFNKEFKANIQICQKRFAGSKHGGLFSKTKYNKVKMESEEFNKEFRVYAVNDHDAFYVITPSLMERLQGLTKSIKGSFLFCFVNNKLHVGLNNNKDSFEPKSSFFKIKEEKVLSEVTGDIDVITKFVEDLNLDNDLFKKEV